MSEGRILFIDAYDSFSNSITRLLQEELGVCTETIKIDDSRFVLNDDAFHNLLQEFDAVVAGPGPGRPDAAQDVGLIGKLWSLPEGAILPVLGICLGFQSLCVASGARTCRLHEPRHGLITQITHKRASIFADAQDVHATQYHSLHMVIDDNQKVASWQASRRCPKLMPIAWDLSDARNGPILMAVQHVSKPFVGVQFHPESICTNAEGRQLVCTWWQQVCSWNATQRHGTAPKQYANGIHKPHASNESSPTLTRVSYHKLDLSLDVLKTSELCRSHNSPLPIILHSGTRHGQPLNPETGRFSIIGLPEASSKHIRYSCRSQTLTVTRGEEILLTQHIKIRGVFSFLKAIMDGARGRDGPAEVPFWGGLVGYISYEAGLASIDIEPSPTQTLRHDIWFVFVERSIVIDHVAGVTYVQSIRPDDACWLAKTASLLTSSSAPCTNGIAQAKLHRAVISQPQEASYIETVVQCQEHLRAGSSYELCLTAQTAVTSNEDPWTLYCRLSRFNPAPFGAFLDLHDSNTPQAGVNVVGSSPERFLSWSRAGKCQFRPIKGTVSKADGTTRKEAEAILRTQKEMAENLMIVDLIRHDLAGVKGVHNVRVPSLMSVEEYETVFQLVSVIEGDLEPSTSGLSVLAASLPPGSMTGAPKKRSCELLKDLEDDQPRGLYSGVIGYLDVGGGGDFSVVIRTAFKWADEDAWRIGAGGAVTVLSTPEGEYEEMLVKRERLLNVLMHS